MVPVCRTSSRVLYIYIKTDKKIYRFIVVNSASDVGREGGKKRRETTWEPHTRDGKEKKEEEEKKNKALDGY
jgi:hypothetical protein